MLNIKKTLKFFCFNLPLILALTTAQSVHANTNQKPDKSFFSNNFTYEKLLAPCSGNCGGHIFAGKFLNTGMWDAAGFDNFVPPSQYDIGKSGMLGMAFSKRLLTGFNSFSIEGEVGVAQRFGPGASAAEGWGAFYARWHNFPWNDFVYTTAALSTGLNLATVIDDVEKARSKNNSKLLHYLSPEITFARPDKKDTHLVLRLHHRSGGRRFGWESGLFGGTGGGAQYLTVGIRQNF